MVIGHPDKEVPHKAAILEVLHQKKDPRQVGHFD
jgi:hypothetical protein